MEPLHKYHRMKEINDESHTVNKRLTQIHYILLLVTINELDLIQTIEKT